MSTVQTADVVTALLGDLADGYVSKMGPDVSEVHTPGLNAYPVRKKRVRKDSNGPSTGRKVAEGIGLGATAIGTAYGVKELAHQLPEALGADSKLAPKLRAFNTKLAAKAPNLGPKTRVGIAGGLLAGDATATAVLGSKPKPPPNPNAPVTKAEIPLDALRAGRLQSMKSMLGLGKEADPILAGGAKAKASLSAQTAGRSVTSDGRRVMSSTTDSKASSQVPRVARSAPPVNTNLKAAAQDPAALKVGTPAPRPAAPAPPPDPVAASPAPPAAPAMSPADRGAAAREHLNALLSTTGGKVTAGAAVGGTYLAGRRSGQNSVYKGVSDVTFGGEFSKFDNDKRQAFGWASVVELNGEPVVDRQGDYIGIDDIEEAAYVYVRKSRVAGDMHRRTEDDQPFQAGELIESVVFTKDKCEAMGLPSACAGKWWIGVQVDDEDTWGEVKKKARNGFSIHGRGIRKDTTLEEIRGF